MNKQYKYNSEGYDSEGYDSEGYDSEGYDSEGYDSEGFNRQSNDADNIIQKEHTKTSNSKLSKDQKAILKQVRKDFEDNGGMIFSFPEIGATVAVNPVGKTMQVSLSIMSKEERKFRVKVGAFHALMRMASYQYIIVNLQTGIGLYTAIETLADMAVNG